MKRKKTTAAIIVIILCICAVAAVFIGKKSLDRKKDGRDRTSLEDTRGSSEESAATSGESSTPAQGKTEKEKGNTEDSRQNGNSANPEFEGETSSEDRQTETGGDLSEETDEMIFPYDIEGQKISITYLNGYDGLYIEDGADQEIENVTAILVKNNSDKALEYGEIILDADGEELNFTFSSLPAGKSCIVMEKNQTEYNSKWRLRYKDGDFAFMDSLSKEESKIGIKIKKDNGITITNKTDTSIPRLRIFYKYQLDSGEYVGGITYNCKLDDLESGESRTIYPSHFSKEGSVVMMVRVYDSKEE